MTRYLLTPSLYSSWQWYMRLEDKTKDDFLKTLRKIKEPLSDAAAAGIAFENDVVTVATGGQIAFNEEQREYEQCVNEIADIVRGSLWQERAKREVTVSGVPLLLYGKMDAVKRDWIYDIKKTGNYDIGKYTDTIQHSLYMHCTGFDKFAYLISDGRSVWREDYFYDQQMEDFLYGEMACLLDHIMSDADFKAAYIENWQSKP